MQSTIPLLKAVCRSCNFSSTYTSWLLSDSTKRPAAVNNATDRGYMEQPVRQPESAVMAPTFAMCAAA